MDIVLIAAVADNGVIGRGGAMPWRLKSDMRHFRSLTAGKPVVMGRKTWGSLAIRPLPGRTNIVVTRQEGWGGSPAADGAVVVSSLDEALLESQFAPGNAMVWIVGGGEIYRQSMELADVAVVTVIDSDTDGDTYAPELGERWELASSEPDEGWLESKNGTNYRITTWRRTED
jgi:dihydrofolate reductase